MILIRFSFLPMLVLFFVKGIHPKEECSISLSDLNPEPIGIWYSNKTVLYPKPNQTVINLSTSSQILISCPGSYITSLEEETVLAQCVENTKFTIDEKSIDFKTLSCSESPQNVVIPTGKSCESNGFEAEIGFSLYNGSLFIPQLRICFDLQLQTPLYSTFNLTKSIGSHESNISRPYFSEDQGFYKIGNKTVNELYLRKHQQATINNLLGLPIDSDKYIEGNGPIFLARGHLSAKADFVYPPQQLATFHYINAVPQFESFNEGNWESIEFNIREYAEMNEVEIIVYTGTFGISTLPHEETGEEIELYLFADGENVALPVPKFMWKVAYQPETKAGVAFIGLNNPYADNIQDDVICEDISSQLKWLIWDKDNVTAGFSYACQVDHLRNIVDYIPEFEVVTILN